jgi:hypothetical protein
MDLSELFGTARRKEALEKETQGFEQNERLDTVGLDSPDSLDGTDTATPGQIHRKPQPLPSVRMELLASTYPRPSKSFLNQQVTSSKKFIDN